MAAKQTRRSVSIRGVTYRRLRIHAERTGKSMSAIADEYFTWLCDCHCIEDPGVDPPSLAPPRKVEEIAGQHFTF